MTILSETIIAILICICGFLIITRQKTKSYNKDIEEKNKIIQEIYERNLLLDENLTQQISQKQQSHTDLLNTLQLLQDNYKQEKQHITEELEYVHSAETARLNTAFQIKKQSLIQEYEENKEQYVESYLQCLSDYSDSWKEMVSSRQFSLQEIDNKIISAQSHLQDLQSLINAAVAEQKRRNSEEELIKFYTLNLSEEDIKEIAMLKEIVPHLRDAESFNKIIWKSYYEAPYNQLMGRILEPGKICGIYKITNMQNKKVYIGQSVDVKERFRQHIKAGLGIGGSNNNLYTAMRKYGVENFSFELIEKCSRDQLNDKEKYWISYFHGEDYGYNMTKGGS